LDDDDSSMHGAILGDLDIVFSTLVFLVLVCFGGTKDLLYVYKEESTAWWKNKHEKHTHFYFTRVPTAEPFISSLCQSHHPWLRSGNAFANILQLLAPVVILSPHFGTN
jgi:hypothetical protein